MWQQALHQHRGLKKFYSAKQPQPFGHKADARRRWIEGQTACSPRSHRTSLWTSRRYLELSGVNALLRDLRDKDIRTKIRLRATGATHGGIPFERGSLFYLLRNRFYIGEVKSSPSSSAASKAIGAISKQAHCKFGRLIDSVNWLKMLVIGFQSYCGAEDEIEIRKAANWGGLVNKMVYGKSGNVTAAAHKPIDAIADSYRKTGQPRAYKRGRSTPSSVTAVSALTVSALTVLVLGECWRRQTYDKNHCS
jgi:hypothetical protein